MEKGKVFVVLSAYFVLNLHQIINENVVREPSFASEMDMLFCLTCLAVNKYSRGRNRDACWRRRVWAWPRPQVGSMKKIIDLKYSQVYLGSSVKTTIVHLTK